ncbi:MAG: Hpt domain-containing protein [Candidatus Magnetomorum sp.]|nr:Hpt domain-containing protein [Candidatus Magnetomorum sp.]
MKQTRSILNTELVMNRLNGDQFLFKALYRIYPKQIKSYMQDIEKSMANEDFLQLATFAHSLESCFMTLGAELCEDANKRLSKELKTGKWDNIPIFVEMLKNELDQFLLTLTKTGIID